MPATPSIAPHRGSERPAPRRLIGEEITDLSALAEALTDAMLPVDDLDRPGRRFFRYRTPEGLSAGFGGDEPYGPDVLLRSIVVLREARGQGVGGAILEALMVEASAAGGVTAYLITSTAATFFERHGFTVVDRSDAPASILSTAQASGICSTTAPLMMRPLPRPACDPVR